MPDLVERQMDLPAGIEEVWAAVTDPAWLQSWLADDVWLELRPGGDARFAIGDSVRTGWVEEVVAPGADAADPLSPAGAGAPGPAEARLAFWWAEDGEPASRVELSLTRLEDGTRLRVVETRPLELLDLVGVPLPGHAGRRFGPALVAA
ncbi:MAG TPA: SRPBCC domain-containing protein [Solirubrobacteraceae bacterium]|nr:SRPBCC domain-containing protein [Solirubrobacteraceae bacterium]